MVYLDHAAATPVRAELLSAHADLCAAHPANPHAASRVSAESRFAIERAGRDLLAFLDADETVAQVLWTSGGTESTNLACLGCMESVDKPVSLVAAGAHAAVLEPCRQGRARGGLCQEWALDRDGRLRLDSGAGVERRACLAALCHVNNETGAIHDLVAVRRHLRRSGSAAALMVDAIQSFGKLDIPWREAEIDFLAISGRKIGGPASVAALVCRRGLQLAPLLFGGGQQDGIRPGTQDVVGILEFVEAARLALAARDRAFQHVTALNDTIRRMLRQRRDPVPEILSPATASPYILSVAFPGYEGAVLTRLLGERDVIVGAGSACSAAEAAPSHVLTAMGVAPDVARAVLRISLDASTVRADVETFFHELDAVFKEY